MHVSFSGKAPSRQACAVALSSCVCCVAAYAAYKLRRRHASRLAAPPMPPSKSLARLLGMDHTYVFAAGNQPHILTDWADEYGGIYKLQLQPGTEAYVISDASWVTDLLRGEHAQPKAPFLAALNPYISLGHPNIITTSHDSSAFWRSFRKQMLQSFSSNALQKGFPAIRSCVEEMVEMWRQQQGQPVDVSSWMARVLLEMLGRASFGLELNGLKSEHHEYLEAMHKNSDEIMRDFGNPLRPLFARLLPFLPFARESAAAKKQSADMIHKVYADILAKGPPKPDDLTMAANLMRVVNCDTGEPFPVDLVKGNLSAFTLAGYDTTANTSMWALYDIAQRPEVQSRIKQELAAAGLLQVQGRPPARRLQWQDVNALPYLNMVLKESMRMHPVISTGTFRHASTDLRIGGYKIKKGSMLWLSFYAVHNSHINFTCPKAFIPERWSHPDSPEYTAAAAAAAAADTTLSSTPPPKPDPVRRWDKSMDQCPNTPQSRDGSSTGYTVGQCATLSGHTHAQATSMLPFALGSRACVGQPLANVEARILLLILLANFWIELDPATARLEAAELEHLALVLTSKVPIKLQLKPHTSA